MSKDKKPSAQDIATDLTIAATAKATATFVTSNPVAGVVVGGVVGAALSRVKAVVKEKLERRTEVWWKELLEDETMTPDGAAARVTERLNDPDVADAVYRTVRAALDTPDEAAIAPLARLAKEVIGGMRPVDRFFRGAAQMLAECDARDIEDLRLIVEAAAKLGGEVTFGNVEDDNQLNPLLRKTRQGVGIEDRMRLPTTIDSARAVHLLGAYGLAREANIYGGAAVNIRAETVQHLARILGPSTPPAPVP